MTPEQLAETVVAAVAAAVGAGELAVAVPETVTVERPKDRGHGDYATNVALRLAKEAGRPPRAVAELLAARLKTADGVASVEIADPGFLNIRLAAGAAGELARAVVTAGSAYGRSDALAGRRIDLEVVSADPTEPLPLGHIRRAVVGDALVRILTAAGATVTRTQSVKLAKRTGTLITLDGLIDQIGPDAARYALVRSAPDHDLVLDIDVLTRHTSDNPLWTVQYAHAWTSSILRYAADLGLDLGSGGQFRPELLVHPREETLLAALAEYPRVVAQAAELREVHKVAHQLETVSKAHHAWQSERKDCRVLPQGGEPPTDVNRARLWLVAATRIVLANGLELLGVSAPERM